MSRLGENSGIELKPKTKLFGSIIHSFTESKFAHSVTEMPLIAWPNLNEPILQKPLNAHYFAN